MNWFQQLFARRRLDRDLADEIEEHLREKTEELVEAGMSREEAAAAARRDFGNLGLIREDSRAVWSSPQIEDFLVDVRYGARMLRRNPGFAIVVALTLALGIGVNTAIFSVVESVLLRPLPYHDPDRLFAVWINSKEQGTEKLGASMPEFEDYKAQSRSFEYIANVLPGFTYVWDKPGDPRLVLCTGISFDFFPMLAIRPLLGRLYTPQEYHVDGVQVVLSEKFWKEQFGGDPRILGRVFGFDNAPMTVIGVMPSLADLFPDTDIWAKDVPDFTWARVRSNHFLSLVGRLKPGVSREQAELELTAILHRGPGESQSSYVTLVPFKDEVTGPVRSELEIVMAAAGLVLLIMCANITYLLLARSAKRQAEIAVRMSLGAGKGRILRQFATENLLIALTGGALGVLLAVNCIDLVTRLNLGDLPRGRVIGVDLFALLFAIAISFAVTLLVAWAPAAIFSRLDLHSTLKTGRSEAGSVGKSRFRVLLVSEVSLAVVLLVAAGLLMRSFWEAQHRDPGFRADHVLTAYLRTDWNDVSHFFPELVERAVQLPGAQSAAVANCTPGSESGTANLIFNDRANDPYHTSEVPACWISPDFFRTMGTRLLAGRFFTAHDNATAQPTVIINKALAEAYWPGEDPIGKQVAVDYVGGGRTTNGIPRFRQVVGMVENVKQQGLDVPAEPGLYTPYLQDETNHVFGGMNVFVRTAGDPRLLAETLRKQVQAIRAHQPVDSMRTMNDVLYQTLAPRRFGLILVGSFAGLAVLLTAIGIFGMIAYAVSQRTREFGLRMALGAERAEVLGLVLKEAMILAATGVVLGAAIAIFFARAMTSLLFAVSATDPLAFAGAIALLAIVATCACFFPALRATKVDPLVALRDE